MSKVKGLSEAYENAISTLARWHGEGEDPPVDIYSFDDSDERNPVVRLVEVSDGFLTTGEPWPVTFGRSDELPYPSTVILVSTEDWQRVTSGEIQLPPGWDLGKRRKVWPE